MTKAVFSLGGLPGSGKGTQLSLLEALDGIQSFSCGDIFRAEVKSATPFGRLAVEAIQRGEMVSDKDTCSMLFERLRAQCVEKSIVIDGFPRTVPQATMLIDFLPSIGYEFGGFIRLHGNRNILIQRILDRRVCNQCGKCYNYTSHPFGICPVDGADLIVRDDDRPDVIQHRFDFYSAHDANVSRLFDSMGLLQTIDAHDSVSAVHQQIVQILKAKRHES